MSAAQSLVTLLVATMVFFILGIGIHLLIQWTKGSKNA